MTFPRLHSRRTARVGTRRALWLLCAAAGSLPAVRSVHAQQGGQSGIYIDPALSDKDARLSSSIKGNQVETLLSNYGLIGLGNGSINRAGVWPRGTGHGHLHMMTPIIAATVTANLGATDGQPVRIVSDGYIDNIEREPGGTLQWKFQPLSGYQNTGIAASSREVANSLNAQSWPGVWPGYPSEWNGRWLGYFGLNQFNADQEVLYRIDDSHNNEFLSQFRPDPARPEMGGLGMQIEVRHFQWSQPLAQDVLFNHYQVSNIGKTTFNTTNTPIFFGGYADLNMAGSGATDDVASFDRSQDMVFAYSYNGERTGRGIWTTFPNIPPGYMGWKFLESPGISTDGRDNDDDGMTDERRDNAAGQQLTRDQFLATLSNLELFRARYGEPSATKTVFWSGDEDGDWNAFDDANGNGRLDYEDLNNNGVLDEGEDTNGNGALDLESINDDKGSDGIGPGEDGYPGADADGTEGNGRPDQGEPNFGKTDNDESDQVGLTSFSAPNIGNVAISDEPAIWERVSNGQFELVNTETAPLNLGWLFGSGPFNLTPAQTERFSTAFVFGFDRDAIFRAANVAQRIYDSDYQFAKPPLTPRLTATPADGKVILTWDSRSERSRDPIYGFDFEGYQLIRSTDPSFQDAKTITDAQGNPQLYEAIAQFDLADGLTGPHPLQYGQEQGAPQGYTYFTGKDTGLQHYYEDTKVINGRTYYYALVAYDKGFDLSFVDKGIVTNRFLFPITPASTPFFIDARGGGIKSQSLNTAIATPRSRASTFTPGASPDSLTRTAGLAAGRIGFDPVVPDSLHSARYTVTFTDAPVLNTADIRTASYTITDQTTGQIVRNKIAVPQTLDRNAFTSRFDAEVLERGFVLNFTNRYADTARVRRLSGFDGDVATDLVPRVTLAPSWPSPIAPSRSIMIEFGDPNGPNIGTAFTGTSGTSTRPTKFKVVDLATGAPVEFIFTERSGFRNGIVDSSETITIAARPLPLNANDFLIEAWKVVFRGPTDPAKKANYRQIPAGTRFIIRTDQPFGAGDVFEGETTRGSVRTADAGDALGRIRVVPNPFKVTNEGAQPFPLGSGPFIQFTHLPASATVRIYTLNGRLIKTIQHDGSAGSSGEAGGVARWDLVTEDGLNAAYGLYIYHVTAPGVGETTGKFAIIR